MGKVDGDSYSLNEPHFYSKSRLEINRDYKSNPNYKKIIEREKKIETFRKKVLDSVDDKYDRKGIISIPRFSTNSGMEYGPNDKINFTPEGWIVDFIDIEITLRELAEAGLLPEDFKWKAKTRITPRDLAEADKKTALTTQEVGSIQNLINDINLLNKGKGEK